MRSCFVRKQKGAGLGKRERDGTVEVPLLRRLTLCSQEPGLWETRDIGMP